VPVTSSSSSRCCCCHCSCCSHSSSSLSRSVIFNLFHCLWVQVSYLPVVVVIVVVVVLVLVLDLVVTQYRPLRPTGNQKYMLYLLLVRHGELQIQIRVREFFALGNSLRSLIGFSFQFYWCCYTKIAAYCIVVACLWCIDSSTRVNSSRNSSVKYVSWRSAIFLTRRPFFLSSPRYRYLVSVVYEGHPKSFQPRHIGQQYFPQAIHQWNVHPLLTHTSLLRIWRRCNLWRHRALNRNDLECYC